MASDPAELAKRLAEPDDEIRQAAAQSLLELGPDAQPAAVALVAACADANEEVREAVIGALEAIGPPPTKDLAAIAKQASSDEADIAYWAVTLLGRAGAEAVTLEGPLVEALVSHGSQTVRERAAWALGRLPTRSPKAIAALQIAAASSFPRLSRLATQALQQ